MRLLIRIFSLLPLSVLYHIADLLLYPLIYYVARYRLQVVRQNLQASFPDKSPDECLQIEREFYHHFADILDMAPLYLSVKEQDELRSILFPQMEENMKRIKEELDWFEMKFDYRYKDADWKTSRDAVQRAMQKVVGGYPADDVYRQK